MLRLALNLVVVFLGLRLVVHADGPLDSSEGELFSAGHSIPIAESHRFGPLARGEGFRSFVVGTANVFGNGPYDLFLAPDRLFPFQGFEQNGAPRYGMARVTQGQPLNGAVISGPNNEIYGLFPEGRKIRLCKFNREALTFESFALSKNLDIPHGIGSGIGGGIDADGKLNVYFSISDGTEYRPPAPPEFRKTSYFPYYHDATFMPYDGAGFWRGKIPRKLFYHVRFTSPALDQVETLARAGEGPGEFLFDQSGLAVVRLGKDRAQAVITSEKQGTLRYFPIDSVTGSPGPQQFVNDEDEVAFRHFVINPNLRAIPDPQTGLSNLILGDTGRIWFLRFTGNFSATGSPVYKSPVPVLAEGVHLALGELPVISPGDVDGDKLIDFIAGNDAGQLLFVRNIGSAGRPEFDDPIPVLTGGKPLDIKGGYRGSVQGPGEAMWGYTCPTLKDWNGDGRPDVILNSILADYMVLFQLPASSNGVPAFSEPRPLYCDGLQLHLAWRSQPAITDWGLGERLCMIALDEENLLRMFWRIDNQNVERGDLLRLQDGSPITANADEAAGQTGRAKLVPHDWDSDGNLDLVIGTSRGLSFPAAPNVYYPSHFYPNHKASVLLLRNVGSNREPVFDYVRFVEFNGKPIGLGIHSCSPAPVDFGNGRMDLFVGEEIGSIKYYPRSSLSVSVE